MNQRINDFLSFFQFKKMIEKICSPPSHLTFFLQFSELAIVHWKFSFFAFHSSQTFTKNNGVKFKVVSVDTFINPNRKRDGNNWLKLGMWTLVNYYFTSIRKKQFLHDNPVPPISKNCFFWKIKTIY